MEACACGARFARKRSSRPTSSCAIVLVCLYSSTACLMIDLAPCGMLIVKADLSFGSIGTRFDTTRGPYDMADI